ncbi:MAG: glycosyltransferase [Pseudomonadota bacterium]
MNTRETRLPALDGIVDATGLAHLYRLLLGREAEPAVLAAAEPRPLHALVDEMATSDEIGRHVLHALVQQRPLPHESLDAARLAEAERWFAGCNEGRGLPPAPGTPPAAAVVLAAALAAPALQACLLQAHGSLFTEAWQALQARARLAERGLQGRIEFANLECISGWAARLVPAAGPLQLEVRCEGRLVASAVACSHRPDIQQRLGGDGLVGFRARWQPGVLPQAGPLHLTLHDAATGLALGPPYRHENSPGDQLGVAQLLAREFDELQRRLDALAGLVPQALGYAAMPLARFDLYRRLHRVPPPPARDGGVACITVLLDAQHAGPRALRLSIDSLRALSPDTSWRAWVVGATGDTADAAAALTHAEPRLRLLADWDHALAAPEAAPIESADWRVLLQAGECLDLQALNWVAHAASGSAPPCLAYWDEDQLDHPEAQPPARAPRHHSPVLRARFDPHAMLEMNVVGRSFAVQAAALRKAAARVAAQGIDEHPLSPGQREALLWSLTRDGRFEHLPHFLLTRTDAAPGAAGDGAPPLSRLAARAEPAQLKALLPAAWRAREWHRVPDPLAPGTGKPLVHWRPLHPRALISVLVPTRDHGELVQQCLGSLRQLADEPGAVEFIVADNGSTDEATLAFLATAESGGELRCLRIDEPFNWSRLNNRLAEASRGELLLFLNDDTRMLTRGWDTVLRGQLEDPQVGAVGARLLYEDMTVQHAGVRFGQEGFLGHIAVGQGPEAVEGFPASQLTREVSAVTGAFLACRRDTWQRVGPFDEQHLAVTYNDVDWCVRVRRTGLKVLYAPALSLVHFESKSRGFDFLSGAKQQRADHERQQLLRLHPEGFANDPFHPPALHAWTPHVTSL